MKRLTSYKDMVGLTVKEIVALPHWAVCIKFEDDSFVIIRSANHRPDVYDGPLGMDDEVIIGLQSREEFEEPVEVDSKLIPTVKGNSPQRKRYVGSIRPVPHISTDIGSTRKS